MEPDDLPDPGDLWWSWVVLAALHRAVGDERCVLDERLRMLHLETGDGSWVRMQRTLGSRAVVWGRSLLAPPAPADAREAAPDWALTEALEGPRPTFLAWFAHGEWDTSSPGADEGAAHLLRPILTVDPRAAELARAGRLDADALARWTDGEHLEAAAELAQRARTTAPTGSVGAVRARLRDQIHDQMRDAQERDRMLLQRPPVLVRWLRASGPRARFEYAVMMTRQRTVVSPTSSSLSEPVARSLANVLTGLHSEEAGEQSGAWLFARVVSDGVVIVLERAFDSWPEWFQVRHVDQGPSLEDLAWEMQQRSAAWRPLWASLLPSADRG